MVGTPDGLHDADTGTPDVEARTTDPRGAASRSTPDVALDAVTRGTPHRSVRGTEAVGTGLIVATVTPGTTGYVAPASGSLGTPTVTITSPSDPAAANSGDDISWAATATDPDDGDLAASLTWTSDLDGEIGTGGSFTAALTTVGTHVVTASVTDSDGNEGSDTVTVEVSAASILTEIETITLAVDTAQVCFESIAGTYESLMLVGRVRTDRANDTDTILMTVGNGGEDTGLSYQWAARSVGDTEATTGSADDTSAQVGWCAGNATAHDSFSVLRIIFPRYADTGDYRAWFAEVGFAVNAANRRASRAGGSWQNTADALDTICLAPLNGTNLLAGTKLTLYGVA